MPEISGNTRGKMERFPIKPGQPTGMILAILMPFPNPLIN